MELHFTWKVNKGKYSSGESLYLNRIRVASYEWNSTRSRDAVPRELNYLGSTFLPKLGRRYLGDTTEEIKELIEQSVRVWFLEATK